MRPLGSIAVLCTLAVACGSVSVTPIDGGAGHGGTTGAAGKTGGGGAGGAGTASTAGTGAAGASGMAGSTGTAGGTAGTTGAAGGAGGHGGAGSAGAGGETGTAGAGGSTADGGVDAAPEDCAALKVEYANALKDARICNPLSRVAQCQAAVPNALACPSCDTHVQATARLDDIVTKWTKQDCRAGICSDLHCATAGTGVCQASDGGSTGTCVDQKSLATAP
ncbi:MAG TPA: hypothetical protein VLA14_14780 [Polyangia bacterium]|jgi:hypothetical protein|nr:hypothetical protein [Polyangia bacterium]